MNQIRERLHRAIEQQRVVPPAPPPETAGGGAEAAFRPVREAAKELSEALDELPGLRIDIQPASVWIALYDKHFWLSYDPEVQAFVGSETDTLWMEGGIRERAFRWDSADACTEAMIQACARYVFLAEAIRNLSVGRR